MKANGIGRPAGGNGDSRELLQGGGGGRAYSSSTAQLACLGSEEADRSCCGVLQETARPSICTYLYIRVGEFKGTTDQTCRRGWTEVQTRHQASSHLVTGRIFTSHRQYLAGVKGRERDEAEASDKHPVVLSTSSLP
ncbi:hypothetical protein CGRA01v4_06547 [Colletotrichum graminicola]|nr:hypothetical protein CGRA01v4_06547 [Colletotrichum graminicola]